MLNVNCVDYMGRSALHLAVSTITTLLKVWWRHELNLEYHPQTRQPTISIPDQGSHPDSISGGGFKNGLSVSWIPLSQVYFD